MDRDLWRRVLDGFSENRLLTYGSAIAFRLLVALIPLLLSSIGLLGALGLERVYRDDVVPNLRDSVSPPMFEVIDSTVRKVLTGHQGFWITMGAVLALWEMSSAVRCVMEVLDDVYRVRRERSKGNRYKVSILLALGCGALVLLAVAIHQVVPAITDSIIGVLRWPIVAALLFGAVTLVIHYAPAEERPWQGVGFGSGLVVVAWLATSAVFGFYVTQIADYSTIFGNLATVWITFQYLYFASCAFLTGAQVDQILRERREASQGESRIGEDPVPA